MKKWLKDRAANFHCTHSSLLALVVVIIQAGKVDSNTDLTEVKCDNNKLSIVEKEHVTASGSPNNLNDWKKEFSTQKNSLIFHAVDMSYAFITQFVNMINCIIFHVKVITLVLPVLSQQHTNCEWTQCQIVEVYCQLQTLWNEQFW